MQIGRALKLIRKYHDVEPVEQAKRLKLTEKEIIAYEQEKEEPTLKYLERVARLYKLTSVFILQFAQELKTAPKDMLPFTDMYAMFAHSDIISFVRLLERTDLKY